MAQSTPVKLLTDKSFMPYSFLKDGIPDGLYVEMIKRVDEKLVDYDIELEFSDWGAAKARVKAGTILGLVGPYYHAHDWEYMYPYSIAIDHDHLITVCNINVRLKANPKWPQDYEGLKVGTIAGYDAWRKDTTYGQQIHTVNFFEFPNVNLALKGVDRQIVDCTMFEQGSFSAHIKLMGETGEIKKPENIYVATHISQNAIYIGYSATGIEKGNFPYALDFKKAFDIAFYELLNAGEFESLYQKYNLSYY